MAKDLKFHEAANIFPLMDEDELDELGKDIKENGLQVPIQLYDGLIIDGRNRYKACLIHCPNSVYCEDVTDEVEDPIAYVRSLNLHRRHLDDSQRAICAGKCRDLYDKQAKERQLSSLKQNKGIVPETFPERKGDARDKVAEDWGVSGRLVDDATKVLKTATPEVVQAIERGNMTVTTGRKLSAFPVSVQKRAAKAAKEKGNKAAVCVLKNEARKAVLQPVVNSLNDDCLKREANYDEPVGVKHAIAAINELKKIPADDRFRARGMGLVEKWIAENK